MKSLALALLATGITLSLLSFKRISYTTPPPPQGIVFRDTCGPFVTDSLTHNMGTVGWGCPVYLCKYFKYIGRESCTITQSWTGDPHFICEYPKEPLIRGKVYGFKVCFCFTSKIGPFDKDMGFTLSTYENIRFKFKGNVNPAPSREGSQE